MKAFKESAYTHIYTYIHLIIIIIITVVIKIITISNNPWLR